MNDELAPILSSLPEPAAPASLTATVMARIEREAIAQPLGGATRARQERSRDVWLWITASVGVLLVVGAVASSWYVHGLPDVFSPRTVRGGIGAGFAGWQATIAGIAGLILCLRALFAPLRSR